MLSDICTRKPDNLTRTKSPGWVLCRSLVAFYGKTEVYRSHPCHSHQISVRRYSKFALREDLLLSRLSTRKESCDSDNELENHRSSLIITFTQDSIAATKEAFAASFESGKAIAVLRYRESHLFFQLCVGSWVVPKTSTPQYQDQGHVFRLQLTAVNDHRRFRLLSLSTLHALQRHKRHHG